MSLVQIILVVIVAFIIGCSSVNDQIETYQPVVACSLIGLVTGHLELGVMLGGSLQLITMGWANVGAAMVINMMSSREVWPFFFLGFALAALKELTLISLGIIGLCLAVMYLALEASGSNGSSNDGGSGDPLGEILEDF